MIRTKATPARFKDLSPLIIKKHLNILAMEVERLSREPHSLSSISHEFCEWNSATHQDLRFTDIK